MKFVKLSWVNDKHFQASASGNGVEKMQVHGLPKLAAWESCNYGDRLLIRKRFQIGAEGASDYI
jgi:hypothetical protein